jgi:anaerobic ribonucleoside-triphosphate reductase activating protein
MRYSGLIKNDITAAPGICVSFFTQGCPHHCPGCHNPETWGFDGGKEFTNDTLKEIIESLTAQNIQRDLCIMGGEPLCEQNAFLTRLVIQEVKKHVPGAKIYIWSGYTYEELKAKANPHILDSLRLADVLIDGPYIEAERDITLEMRGSRNQRVIDLSEKI